MTGYAILLGLTNQVGLVGQNGLDGDTIAYDLFVALLATRDIGLMDVRSLVFPVLEPVLSRSLLPRYMGVVIVQPIKDLGPYVVNESVVGKVTIGTLGPHGPLVTQAMGPILPCSVKYIHLVAGTTELHRAGSLKLGRRYERKDEAHHASNDDPVN